MSNIEIEVRGELNKQQYKQLLAFFNENAKPIKTFKRFQMLFFELDTDDLNAHIDIKQDLRIRVQDSKAKIVMKYVTWHDQSEREELEIPIGIESVDETVRMFYLMGKKHGKIMLQHTHVFDYKGIEWAIVNVPGKPQYFYWEAETSASGGIEDAKTKLHSQVSGLRLSELSSEEFIDLCTRFNNIQERAFDFRKGYNFNEIRERFAEYLDD